MNDTKELYQELILEHNKSPRNFKEIHNATHHAEGYNPLCGDHYTVWLKVEGGKIIDIGFQGNGCAISKSSASMMTASVKGHSITEANELFKKFHTVITTSSQINIPDDQLEELGSLGALAGVREFPARIKCASLAWHAMHSALSEQGATVSTEEEKKH